MPNPSLRILLIDERDKDRELATFILERELPEVTVLSVASAMDFVEAVNDGKISVVVTECQLSWANSERIFKTLQRLLPTTPVIFFSDAPSPNGSIKPRKDMRDVLLKKDSSGFLALPYVVKRLLQANGEYTGSDTAPAAQPARSLSDVANYPLDNQSHALLKDTANHWPEQAIDTAIPVPAKDEHEEWQELIPAMALPASELIDRLPVGIMSLAADGRIKQANAALVNLLGQCDANEIVGKHLSALLDGEESQRLIRKTLACGGDLGLVLSVRNSNSKDVWVRLDLWPVEDDLGQIQHFEGAVIDITADKRREQDIARQNAELGRANAQLEQFAHIAAHDLQAPMGLILRYARLLQNRYANVLDGDAKRYIDHLLDNTRQLHELVDGILEYAKIGSQAEQLEPVDITAVIQQAVDNLQTQFEISGAKLQYGPLPKVTADKNQMVRLWQNLFSNAIKFKSQDKPHIRVWAEKQPGFWRFAVQDNGIGIPLSEQGRIFGMFQRTHSKESYPGNGMGLAICQSIVERHGGELWVESTPSPSSGSGSTFYFTILA